MTALAGVRILDLSRLLPGPLATLVLADLGAQVDKIEDPEAGDYARNMPPLVGGHGAAFHVLNRGKRSAVLDLKRPEGVRAFERLVLHYDVVFEQFRPGVLDRLASDTKDCSSSTRSSSWQRSPVMVNRDLSANGPVTISIIWRAQDCSVCKVLPTAN